MKGYDCVTPNLKLYSKPPPFVELISLVILLLILLLLYSKVNVNLSILILQTVMVYDRFCV